MNHKRDIDTLAPYSNGTTHPLSPIAPEFTLSYEKAFPNGDAEQQEQEKREEDGK